MDSVGRRWMDIPVPEEHVIKVMTFIGQLEARAASSEPNTSMFASKELV